MSFLSIPNVKITGISACVPSDVEEVNSLSHLFTNGGLKISFKQPVLKGEEKPGKMFVHQTYVSRQQKN